MSVEIETYEVLETEGETGCIESNTEALELIEKLCLDGQKSLIVHNQAATAYQAGEIPSNPIGV